MSKEHFLVVRTKNTATDSYEDIKKDIFDKGSTTINNNISRYRINTMIIVDNKKVVIGVYKISGIQFGDDKLYHYVIDESNEDKFKEYRKEFLGKKLNLTSCFPYQSFNEVKMKSLMS